MGHVNTAFTADLLQYLNVELADRSAGDRMFVHSPKLDHYEVRNLARSRYSA